MASARPASASVKASQRVAKRESAIRVAVVFQGIGQAFPVSGNGGFRVEQDCEIAILTRKYRALKRVGQAKSKWDCEMLPIQCRMARTALSLGVKELAELADVSTNTISRFEAGEELKPRTVTAIRAALEAAGVEFIEANGGGPGVRLKKAM